MKKMKKRRRRKQRKDSLFLVEKSKDTVAALGRLKHVGFGWSQDLNAQKTQSLSPPMLSLDLALILILHWQGLRWGPPIKKEKGRWSV